MNGPMMIQHQNKQNMLQQLKLLGHDLKRGMIITALRS